MLHGPHDICLQSWREPSSQNFLRASGWFYHRPEQSYVLTAWTDQFTDHYLGEDLSYYVVMIALLSCHKSQVYEVNPNICMVHLGIVSTVARLQVN